MTQASPTVEELLEEVHRLEERDGAARTKMLGRRLHVTLGTVTNNLSRLQRLGLVKRERYRGTRLTGHGRRIAMSVLRRHRLLERLLTDVLHVGWSKSHHAACKLEHCIDDEVTNAIENVLAHPKTCPHGNAIPSKSGKIVDQASMRLTEISPREAGTMVRVVDEEEEGALAYFESIGLTPGADFTVEGHVPFDGDVNLTLRDSRVTVSKRAASLVVVKKRSKMKANARRN
jgi:DtxR family Mn-dependent transcriptional regulator